MIHKIQEFQDLLSELYPEEQIKDVKMVRDITFQVTENCNLRCTYCYQINKTKNHMNFSTAKKFIDLLLTDSNPYINTSTASGIIIDFIGGEPFLEIDLIDQITDYFISEMIRLHHPWATRFIITICSNGVLYFEPKVQAYIEKNKNHLNVSFSIDGNKSLHDACRVFPDGSGSYDIAIKSALDYMARYNRYLSTKMTISPYNVQYIKDAILSLIDNGYLQIHANNVYEEGWKTEHAKIYYEQLKALADELFARNIYDDIYCSLFDEDMFHPIPSTDIQNWCGGNGDMIAVDWRGNIYPCLRYMESSLGKDVDPIIIGTVDDGIMTTDTQKCTVCKLQSITRLSQSTEKCLNCKIAQGCAWCTAYNYQRFGDANHRATFICQMHQARALANVYFWNLYYRKMNMDKRMKNYVPKDWALEIISEDEFTMLNNLAEK